MTTVEAGVTDPNEPPVATRVAPAVPDDPGLPQLGQLLDAYEVAPAVERCLHPGTHLESVRIHRLRYKPGSRLIASYQVRVAGESHLVVARAAAQADVERQAQKPAHVALARALDGRSPAQSPLRWDGELGALIQWLPLDTALPVLAEPPRALRRRLRDAGVEVDATGEQPPLLGYKPKRRAVLRVDRHVLKLYSREASYRESAARLRAAAELRSLDTAQLEATLPEVKVTVQSLLDGDRLSGRVDAGDRCGALLAALHSAPLSDLPPAPPSRQLRLCASTAGLVATVLPSLRPRIERLLARLEGAAPTGASVVPSHGDFYANQVLEMGERLAVVDLDQMCLAPAALDLASYAAYSLRGDSDVSPALAAVEALVESYGARPEGLSWYLTTCILRRAHTPFRRLDEYWPERVRALVGAAEAALAAR